MNLQEIRNLPMYKLLLKFGGRDTTGPIQEKRNTMRISFKNFRFVFLKNEDGFYISLRKDKTGQRFGEYKDNEDGYSNGIMNCIYKSRGVRKPYSKYKLIEDIFINGIT